MTDNHEEDPIIEKPKNVPITAKSKDSTTTEEPKELIYRRQSLRQIHQRGS